MFIHQKINLTILVYMTLLTACTSISETSSPIMDSHFDQAQKLDQPQVINPITNDIETYLFQGDEFFGFDQTKINEATRTQLDKIIQQSSLVNKHILIVGHTDNRGTFEVNVNISNQRAENVEQYLLRKGINKNDITSIGLGMLYPVVHFLCLNPL